MPDLFFEKVIELFSEWYEGVDEFTAQRLVTSGRPRNPQKKLLRLKPQFRDRMIRAGYST